ncbi:hypothetical protein [Microterricola pindariensis]|uniref:Uncharacterized protein n=1 Tax=Microterricola pindariensis TaxID=478010 RepID=A0ABX5AZ84_9MICO|nr:hypothetical protein [Microterricola pindariensis]PPL20132.1 hypothetical protein GY24_02080 [Microterricola pindariensis]
MPSSQSHPALPTGRPPRHTVLRSFAGHLDAAPDAVFSAIQQKMRAAPGVTVDAAGHEIVQQGGWWYRGEYRVMAEPADAGTDAGTEAGADAAAPGTRLEYEIVNVAQSWHWAGPIAGRRVLAEAPYGFHALLSEIEAELWPELAGESDLDAGPADEG